VGDFLFQWKRTTIELRQILIRFDALLIVSLGKELNLIDQSQDGPSGFGEDCGGHLIGVPAKIIPGRHAWGDHQLDATEKFLML
jgi:hypothetical protein